MDCKQLLISVAKAFRQMSLCAFRCPSILRRLHGWACMHGICAPIKIREPDYEREATAQVDLHVDLPREDVKGIHMSRLFVLLDELLQSGEVLSPTFLSILLAGMFERHVDCGTKRSRARFGFDLLLRCKALVTEGLGGWRRYPMIVAFMTKPRTPSCSSCPSSYCYLGSRIGVD